MQRRNVYKITNTTVSEKKISGKKSKSKHENRNRNTKNRNKKSINRKERRKNLKFRRGLLSDCLLNCYLFKSTLYELINYVLSCNLTTFILKKSFCGINISSTPLFSSIITLSLLCSILVN